jgi:hypothetical protein
LSLLRSGLFFSRHLKVRRNPNPDSNPKAGLILTNTHLKAIARRIRRRIGAPYYSVHLRRSDKLAACKPQPQCAAQRDAATRPDAVLSLVRRFAATPGPQPLPLPTDH